MATSTNENHSMNLISMETQTTPFHPGNNPVLMLVAGLSLSNKEIRQKFKDFLRHLYSLLCLTLSK